MPSYGFSFHSKNAPWPESSRQDNPEITDVEWQIRQALFHGDRAQARNLYFMYMVPDSTFSDNEVERVGYQVGAVDVGDRYVASRSDL